MENKFQLLILSILLLITFLAVYFVFFIIPSESNMVKSSNLSNSNSEVIENSTQKNYTYEEALISGNVLNCALIDNLEKQDICKSKLGVCNTDDCIYSKALDSSNRDICYDIVDESLKLKCSFETFKTKIFNSAVLSDNITLCVEIEDKVFNQRCKDNFYFVKSLNENNISFCDKIIQSDLKEVCHNENN